MSRQEYRGSAGEYQAEEQAYVAKTYIHMYLLHAVMILVHTACIKADNHSPTVNYQISDNNSNADFCFFNTYSH